MSSSPLPNGTTLRSPAPSSAPASSQNPTSSLLSDQIQQRQAEKDLPGGWIVQKFGGTSIGKFPDKIARDIVAYVFVLFVPLLLSFCSRVSSLSSTTRLVLALWHSGRTNEKQFYEEKSTSINECILNTHSAALSDHRIAVVCSARSSNTKNEGTTNR